MKLKNKVLAVTLCASMAVISVTGCGKNVAPSVDTMFAEEQQDDTKSKVSAMNVYTYLDFSQGTEEQENQIIVESNLDIKYEVTSDYQFLGEVKGNYDISLSDINISKDVLTYYEADDDTNTVYSYNADMDSWAKTENDSAQQSYVLDAKTALAIRDNLRELWKEANRERKTQTIKEKEYYVYKLNLKGADYIAFMDKLMPQIGGANDWKETVKKFNKDHKNATLEQTLDNCNLGIIGYVSKDTKKLEMVDMDMSGFSWQVLADNTGITTLDNGMLAGVNLNELTTNTIFMSIVYLDDDENIIIPEEATK